MADIIGIIVDSRNTVSCQTVRRRDSFTSLISFVRQISFSCGNGTVVVQAVVDSSPNGHRLSGTSLLSARPAALSVAGKLMLSQ